MEWRFDDGLASDAVGYALEMINGGVHALFGPAASSGEFFWCPQLLILIYCFHNTGQSNVAALADYYNIPHFIWGKASPAEFKPNYPATFAMSGTVEG